MVRASIKVADAFPQRSASERLPLAAPEVGSRRFSRQAVAVAPAQASEIAEGYQRDKLKIERETQRLIDLVIGSSSPETEKAYESPVSELERQKLLLDENTVISREDVGFIRRVVRTRRYIPLKAL